MKEVNGWNTAWVNNKETGTFEQGRRAKGPKMKEPDSGGRTHAVENQCVQKEQIKRNWAGNAGPSLWRRVQNLRQKGKAFSITRHAAFPELRRPRMPRQVLPFRQGTRKDIVLIQFIIGDNGCNGIAAAILVIYIGCPYIKGAPEYRGSQYIVYLIGIVRSACPQSGLGLSQCMIYFGIGLSHGQNQGNPHSWSIYFLCETGVKLIKTSAPFIASARLPCALDWFEAAGSSVKSLTGLPGYKIPCLSQTMFYVDAEAAWLWQNRQSLSGWDNLDIPYILLKNLHSVYYSCVAYHSRAVLIIMKYGISGAFSAPPIL